MQAAGRGGGGRGWHVHRHIFISIPLPWAGHSPSHHPAATSATPCLSVLCRTLSTEVKPCSPRSPQEGLASSGKERGCGKAACGQGWEAAGPGGAGSPRATQEQLWGRRCVERSWRVQRCGRSKEGGWRCICRSQRCWEVKGGQRGVDCACAVSPGRDSQGVAARTCLVVEEAAVVESGVYI